MTFRKTDTFSLTWYAHLIKGPKWTEEGGKKIRASFALTDP